MTNNSSSTGSYTGYDVTNLTGDDHYDIWDNMSVHVRSGDDPYIPLYIYIVISVLNCVIFVIGLFGNIMVVLVIVRVRDMRTPTNYFLLSLSVADIFVLVICQPAALMEFFAKDRWFIGPVLCKIIPLMENGMLHVSVITMVAVTAERYNAICHPFKRRMTCTASTAVKATLGIWLLAYILTLPFFIMTQLEGAIFYDGTPIMVCRTRIDETWRYAYIIFVFVGFFAFPFIILTLMYARIIQQLVSDTLKTFSRNDPSAVYTLRSRKQVVRMLVFIIILFFLSLCPMRVVTLWLIFTPTEQVKTIGLEGYLNLISFARIMMYLNSAGNPIIYSLTSTKFKIAFNRVFRRYDRCPRRSYSCSTRHTFMRRSFPRRNGNNSKISIPLAERKINTITSQKST